MRWESNNNKSSLSFYANIHLLHPFCSLLVCWAESWITPHLWWLRLVMQTSRCRVVAAMVQSAISVATLTRTSKPNQTQNQCHSGAAAQAAGVESIVIVNQVCIGTNWPWQSNKTFRTYVVATFCTFSASVATIGVPSSGAKEGGSICPAKYTSWPYLAPSSSRSNATVLVAALCSNSHIATEATAFR